MKQGDKYVFPQDIPVESPTKTADFYRLGGMTLRDYFAAQALSTPVGDLNLGIDELARFCYEVADAMLRARNETRKD